MSAPAPPSAGVAPAAALLGAFAVAAQTILARELLVVFHGSELALGLVLAAWLLLGGCGSLLGTLALRNRRGTAAGVAAAAAGAALALPLAVLAARWSSLWLPLPPGAVPGVRLGALAAAAVLAGPAIGGGAWFALAAALRRDASGPGRAYAWEAAGGLGGGVLSILAVVLAVDALAFSALLSAAVLAWCALVAVGRPAARWRALAAGCAALALTAALANPVARLARLSQAARWPGLELLAARDGRGGNLALVRTAGQVTLFRGGSPAFSFPDPESAEIATHLPLLAAPAVGTVLVTEGALGGALAEALKHPVSLIDCVVPDGEVVSFVGPYLPDEAAAALADPRVLLRRSDLRTWLAGHPGAYDAVLLGTLVPDSALANRLATREFFALVRAALRPGGVAAIALPAAPNYRGDELRLRNGSVAAALGLSFPNVEVLRDDPLTLLGSAGPAPLAGAGRLVRSLGERAIRTRTLSPEVVRALLAPDRAGEAHRELAAAAAPVNSDREPSAYFHHIRYREAAADPAAASWLAAIDGPQRWLPFAIPALLAALAALAGHALALRPGTALGIGAVVTGCTAMSLQFLVFFVYQTARGMLAIGLGLLSGLFMGGLAAGGGFSLLLRRRGAPVARMLVAAALALAALPILSGAALHGALAAGVGARPLAADLLAALTACGCGLAAGFAFPLFGLAHPSPRPGTGGALYACDLAGSAAGALGVSLWLLPLLGLQATLVFLTLLASSSALLLALKSR